MQSPPDSKSMFDDFQPLWPFISGNSQTVASQFWPQPKQICGDFVRQLVPIGMEGDLSIAINRPKDWTSNRSIVVLIHGLTGSEDSTHIVRLSHRLVNERYLCIRMNMRGCGPGSGLARGIYHSGRSEDIDAVLKWTSLQFPDSPIIAIGVSLGGNALLKHAGELGLQSKTRKSSHLKAVISISAPIDLAASSRLLSHQKNSVLNRYFSSRLLKHVSKINKQWPDSIPSINQSYNKSSLSLAEFDEVYTAPASGFLNAADYYTRCSALPLLRHINVPTILLTAKDDPIVDWSCYPNNDGNPKIKSLITKSGGHVGWLSSKKIGTCDRFWMDDRVINWISEINQYQSHSIDDE